MNPLLSAGLGSILRWALALGAGYLVKAGIWSGSDAETYVAAGSVALLALGWSAWTNFTKQRVLVTALAHPYPTTQAQIEALIAGGDAVPSATTARTVVPSA